MLLTAKLLGLCLALQYSPHGFDLGFALLGIVLGPVTIWQCLQSLRSGEGDFDRELAPAMRFGAVLMLLAGAAVTLGAAWWLIKWIPEYVTW
jgi:hypothetical protein